MNNPVLLPKRKDYGFLKAPPSLKSLKLVNINASTDNLPSNLINRSNLPNYMRFRLATSKSTGHGASGGGGISAVAAAASTPKKDYITHTTKPLNHLITHKLDNIQIKYELKSPNFSNSSPTHGHQRAVTTKTNAAFNLNNNNNTNNSNSTTPPNTSNSNPRPADLVPHRAATLQNIDFKREHLNRQAYTTETGTNFYNLQRQHSFLSFPVHRVPFKTSIGSLIGTNHYEILTTQISKHSSSKQRDMSPQYLQQQQQHQTVYSSSADEHLMAYGDDDSLAKHVFLNCNNCNSSNNYNVDCIMCKFKNKFNGYNLSKRNKN